MRENKEGCGSGDKKDGFKDKKDGGENKKGRRGCQIRRVTMNTKVVVNIRRVKEIKIKSILKDMSLCSSYLGPQ
jgi:hypothetical protein